MADFSSTGLATALLGGVISFLSPCVLPLVPGYISYVAGRPLGDFRGDNDLPERLRVLGLGLCFVLGFSTVFVIFGASATALGQAMLAYRYELNIAGGAIVAVFGLMMVGLVRFSWLQRNLRFSSPAARGRPATAFVLGLAFAFGWTPCIGPILGAGLVMVVMGIAMMTDQLTVFSYWLLNLFPALAYIGWGPKEFPDHGADRRPGYRKRMKSVLIGETKMFELGS